MNSLQEERFWERVVVGSVSTDPLASVTTPCWLWIGSVPHDGYGRFYIDGTTVMAHRLAYEAEFGSIPDGRELDHLCRVKNCIRGSHLEPVSHRENSLRGDSPGARALRNGVCLRGHSDWWVSSKSGWRVCRVCNRERQRVRRRERYATDPEFRQRISEKNARQYQRRKALKEEVSNG